MSTYYGLEDFHQNSTCTASSSAHTCTVSSRASVCKCNAFIEEYGVYTIVISAYTAINNAWMVHTDRVNFSAFTSANIV